MNRVFLAAEWRDLVMANFAVDPMALKALVPLGTELDTFGGKHYVSIVGFRFLQTRVLGVGIPFHRNFEEVNLRFYVRRKCDGEWRRGVVFVRELVPRRAIAFIAKVFYGEPYLAVPMRHAIERTDNELRVEYAWCRQGSWESLAVTAEGEPQPIVKGSHEDFITDHFWGYTAHRAGCSEYQVEHSAWRYWPAKTVKLTCNVAALYGDRFVDSLAASPVSAFVCDGSPVVVRRRSKHGD